MHQLKYTAYMQPISVVIITKNESHIIAKTVASVRKLTDDIVIADTGSTDNTVQIARDLNCNVQHIAWNGYGKTKNHALEFAKYNWILFLDADEAPDITLIGHIQQLNLENELVVYKMRYQNFIGGKPVKYGEWKRFTKVRLFNKNQVHWDNSDIHEKLVIPAGVNEQLLNGFILHYSIKDLKDYADKMRHYAELVANKYHSQGKQTNWFKLYIYPFYEFFRTYVFHMAMLDGRLGFISSLFSAYYVFFKYHRLKELNQSSTV